MVLCSEGIALAFFMGRAVMPFHAPSFCFQIKVMKPAFITCCSAVKKVFTFNSIPFHSCKVTFFPPSEICAFLSASEEPRGHLLPGIPNFAPSAGVHSALFQSLLSFPWLWFSLMSPIDLPLVSVDAVCMYHYGADQQYLCPSLKCWHWLHPCRHFCMHEHQVCGFPP